MKLSLKILNVCILCTVLIFGIFAGCSVHNPAESTVESGTSESKAVSTEATATGNNETEADSMHSITLEINGKSFSAKLYKNKASADLFQRLPLTLDMNELNGNEKYNYLDFSLPVKTEDIGRIKAGDIMLYGNNCLVVFYESFDTSYSYTKLGYIENPDGLAQALGKDSVTIKFNAQ